MNAKQMTAILQQNGYVNYQYQYLYFWKKIGYGIVAEQDTPAKAAKEAYSHYLGIQEAIEAQRAQAAADSAGEAAYEEARLETLEKENDDLKTQIVNLASESIVLEQQNEELRAENEALKAENALLVAGNEGLRKLLAHVAYEIAGITENVNPLKRDDFRAITSGIRKALQGTPAPAQAASEAPKQASEMPLTDAEIDWLAENEVSLSPTQQWFRYVGITLPESLITKMRKGQAAGHEPIYCLDTDCDTTANRAAISARRKALGLGV